MLKPVFSGNALVVNLPLKSVPQTGHSGLVFIKI